MELKKSPQADLERKKTLFFEIGLCVSLGLMILVFGMSQKEKVIEDIGAKEEAILVETVEITRQEDNMPAVPTPAQALSVISELLEIVDNETQIETEMEFAEFDESLAFNDNPSSSTEIVGTDEPFYTVEDMPKFQGGDLNTFSAWVKRRIVYPQIAQQMGMTGRVVVSFVIERDGSLTNAEVISNTDSMLNEAALKAVNASPKWEPGKQRDVPVRVKFNLPVDFQLN